MPLHMARTFLVTDDHLIPVVIRRVATIHNRRKPNLLLNLRHSLLVFLRRTLASEDGIHLLQTQALRLRHEEPDKRRSNERQKTKEDVCAVRDILKKIRRNLSNDEVVHPVTRATERGTVWTCADGPDLSDQDPRTRAPGVTEMNDEEPNHDDGGPAGSLRVVEVIDVLGEDDGDDYVRHAHADGSNGEDGFAAYAINVEHGGDWMRSVRLYMGSGRKLTSCDEHDDADDACREQRGSVTGQTKLTEDGRRVVKYSINPRPLLEEHSNGSYNDALEHGLGLEEGTNSYELELEGIPSSQLRKMREFLGDTALLEHGLSFDFKILEFDQFVVLGEIAKACKGAASLLFAAVVDEPSGRERHPDHTEEQDCSWEELDTDGHEPCSVRLGL